MSRAGSRSSARWTSGTRRSFAFTGLRLGGRGGSGGSGGAGGAGG